MVLLMVIRPTMKNLMKKPDPPTQYVQNPDGTIRSLSDGSASANGEAAEEQAALAAPASEATLLAPPDSSEDIEQIKQFVQQQPKVSAQIVKGWVGSAGTHEEVIDVACAGGALVDKATHEKLEIIWQTPEYTPHAIAAGAWIKPSLVTKIQNALMAAAEDPASERIL